jgi:threonine aldolase
MKPRYDFASDNTAGACPEAMEALIAANVGFTSGYGTDTVTAQAADAVRALLDADADVRFVASGTAANAVACAALARPFEAVIAHRHAHICTDETGAPGFFGQGGVGQDRPRRFTSRLGSTRRLLSPVARRLVADQHHRIRHGLYGR